MVTYRLTIDAVVYPASSAMLSVTCPFASVIVVVAKCTSGTVAVMSRTVVPIEARPRLSIVDSVTVVSSVIVVCGNLDGGTVDAVCDEVTADRE